MVGLLRDEQMSDEMIETAEAYADALSDLSHVASMDYIEGVGGNVRLHFRDARTIATSLRNALQTIRVLKNGLRAAKQKEAAALQRLGESMLAEQ